MKILILILALILYANCGNSNQLLNAMKLQSQKIAKTLPSGYASLVTGIRVTGLDGFDYCNVSDFDTMMKSYNFSTEVYQSFQMATLSESIEFQAFQVSLKQSYDDIAEFIGAAYNYNGTIRMAFLQVSSYGTPVQQYETYKCCQSCWLVSTCCNNCQREIPMNAAQMDVVTEALRATAYQEIIQFLNNPPTEFANFTQLEDQNQWNNFMSQYAGCSWIAEPNCFTEFFFARANCDQEGVTLELCLIDYVPVGACFLCLCATSNNAQVNQACYDKYYNTTASPSR